MATERELVERLREIEVTAARQGARFNFTPNPLWKESADTITRQVEEIERLRKALAEIIDAYDSDSEFDLSEAISLGRAALSPASEQEVK